jgi:hypothetical protein
MMAKAERIDNLEDYRETLAEIRRLRGEGSRSEEHDRLALLEAAAADYAERLRAADLEKGRPATT